MPLTPEPCVPICCREPLVGRYMGSATGGAPWDAGCLHVEEERRGTTPAGNLPLALFGNFAGLFAVLAAYREWQRTQPLFSDLFATLEAVTVIALLEPRERIVDLVERLGLHLNEREFDVVLDVGLGALDGIEDLVLAAHRRFRADVANLSLNFRLDLAPAVFEHLFQLVITGLRFYLGAHFRIRFHVAAPLPVLSRSGRSASFMNCRQLCK